MAKQEKEVTETEDDEFLALAVFKALNDTELFESYRISHGSVRGYNLVNGGEHLDVIFGEGYAPVRFANPFHAPEPTHQSFDSPNGTEPFTSNSVDSVTIDEARRQAAISFAVEAGKFDDFDSLMDQAHRINDFLAGNVRDAASEPVRAGEAESGPAAP